jgi:glycosyltransferase involved in cell wall biosynthesis
MKIQPDIDDADKLIGRNVRVLLFEDDWSADTELVNGSGSRPTGKRTDFPSPGVAQNYPGRVSSDADIREISSRSDSRKNGFNGSRLNGSSHDASADQLTAARERFEIGKHFDVEYYAREYPDIALDPSQLLGHFCETGWCEGRNPNAFFDTVSYLLHNTDVARSKINPYYHYLKHGLIEGRIVSSSISPSIRTRLLFGESVCDWVQRLRAHVDEDFYRQQLENADTSGLNLAAHFAYRGWREGKSPNPDFDVPAWLEAHPGAMQFAVNPLLVQLEAKAGNFNLSLIRDDDTSIPLPDAVETSLSPDLAELLAPVPGEIIEFKDHDELLPLNPSNTPDSKDSGGVCDQASSGGADSTNAKGNDDDQVNLVRSGLDGAFYTACYPDVAEAGVDPLLHFFHTGWREGRNPSLEFDTKYYLAVNEDVRSAGLNPLLHYLTSGRGEGRLPRRPGGYRRQIIDAAIEPAKRSLVGLVHGEKTLSEATLLRKLTTATRRKKGLIVSLSHDCYIRVIGGTQIFITDEQCRFNEQGYAYIHISPQIARLMLAEQSSEFLVRVVADGNLLGLVQIGAVARALETIREKSQANALFVVHSMMGFHVPDVISLCSAVRAERRIYWLHDYSSICEGYNLLRNDAQFCGAPSSSSLACRVCIYGKTRNAHLESMRNLFEACNFDVVSPSPVTLDLWLRSSDLPRSSATVHPHWRLIAKRSRRKTPTREDTDGTISVAFVGYSSPNKGWPLFSELIQKLGNDQRYQFFHFAAGGTSSLPHVKFVKTEVTGKDRSATKRLLAANQIDFVLILSPWPETFSFVAHEAIAAGAQILCLADSGNVADVVRKLNCGQIFDDSAALIEFLASGAAASLAKANNNNGASSYRIEQSGTSATIEGIARIFEGERP